ncbi:MAG: DUF2012 domain-containing protein [Myxococcaceae bacterium]
MDLARHDVTLSPNDARLSREAHEIDEAAAGHSSSGVVAGSSGQGVTLSLSGTSTQETVTAADGSFRFDGLADGTYQVTPVKTGYRFQPASVSFTVRGKNVEEQNFLSFPMAIAHGISGVITHAPGFTISVGLIGYSLTTETQANQDGAFAFDGLPDGIYRLTPVLDGYTFTPDHLDITVAGADVSGVEFMTAMP